MFCQALSVQSRWTTRKTKITTISVKMRTIQSLTYQIVFGWASSVQKRNMRWFFSNITCLYSNSQVTMAGHKKMKQSQRMRRLKEGACGCVWRKCLRPTQKSRSSQTGHFTKGQRSQTLHTLGASRLKAHGSKLCWKTCHVGVHIAVCGMFSTHSLTWGGQVLWYPHTCPLCQIPRCCSDKCTTSCASVFDQGRVAILLNSLSPVDVIWQVLSHFFLRVLRLSPPLGSFKSYVGRKRY